jgi:SAM-dependent methyltransferase
MSDVWSAVSNLDPATQERLAAVLETRGADAQQQNVRRAFLADVDFPPEARVLDVGCGTGVLTRVLASWPSVSEVVGVDPAASLLDIARDLARDLSNVTFVEADGRSLPYEEGDFDVVVFDSTLCHVPGPEAALLEAYRVLRRGGWMAALDGDYATTTVALGEHDPLQACADATMANSVNDRWLVRRLPDMARKAGFEVHETRSHGFVETSQGGYMITVVDRGADILAGSGRIDSDLASELKAEARRRVEAGTFFGHIAYASITARKN